MCPIALTIPAFCYMQGMSCPVRVATFKEVVEKQRTKTIAKWRTALNTAACNSGGCLTRLLRMPREHFWRQRG
jgi:hypothetical protein